MSSGKSKQPSASPDVAGVDSGDLATNQRSVPAHYYCGIDWCALSWLTDIHYPRYVDVNQKVGKKSSKVGEDVYGSLGGLAAVGLTDAVLAIEVDKQVVWEGDYPRSDTPGSSSYYKATIATSAGKFHIYWGRPDQPLDDVLLKRLNASGFTHPAYRRQAIVICDDTYFGQNKNTAPSIRVKLRRAPKPLIGNFPATGSAQGESIVGASLELLTDPMFGAGMDAKFFRASDWENISAQVIARAGCHSPSMEREQPAKDVVRDLFTYFDGWCRLEKQVLTPGFFPHDGQLPADIVTLDENDFTERPKLPTRKVARAANSVMVKFRDGTQKHREDSVGDTDAANRRVRQRVLPVNLDMPAIIDRSQALAYASLAAASAGDTGKGQVKVRTPRAININTGQRLRAGDNFILKYSPFGYSRAARITKRTEDYKGGVQFDIVPERGCYPVMTPVTVAPPDDLGVALPQPVSYARVIELTPDLAGSPIGIYIAVFAQRPVAKYPEPHAGLTAQNISTAIIHYSRDGASYDYTGAMATWAVRGTLLDPLGAGETPALARVKLADDNIDIARIVAQSESAQNDDTLLMLAGDEVWLVFRDEIGRYAHAQFEEHALAHFKLETCNPGNRLELSKAPDITYTFRDRASEAPKILFDAPPNDAQVGIAVNIGAQFGDSNGDLDRYKFEAQRLDENGYVIASLNIATGAALPIEQAMLKLRLGCVFPAQGTWRLHAIASDEAQHTSELFSEPFTVRPNATGSFELLPTPPAAPLVGVDGGFQQLIIAIKQPGLTDVLGWQLSVQTAPGVVPAVTHDGLQVLTLTIGNLPANATRYVRARAIGKNAIESAWSDEVSGTTLAVDAASVTAFSNKLEELITFTANLLQTANAALAAVDHETTERTDADEALASDITTLRAALQNAAAAIEDAKTASATADQAEAMTRTQAIAQLTDALADKISRAGFQNEMSAIATEISAETDQRTQAISQLTNTISGLAATAYVDQKLTTLTTNTDALAQLLTNLLVTQGDLHAAVQTLTQAYIGPDGKPVARWGVTVDAGGSIASMELYAQGGANPISLISFLGDLVSKNYVARKAGWRLGQNGDAEFNAMLLRNCLTIGTLGTIGLNYMGSVTITAPVDFMFIGPAGLTYRYTENSTSVTGLSTEWPKNGSGVYVPIQVNASRWYCVRGFDNDGAMTEEVQVVFTKAGGVSLIPSLSAQDAWLTIPGSAVVSKQTAQFTIIHPDGVCTIKYRLSGYMATGWLSFAPAAAGTVRTIPVSINNPTDEDYVAERKGPSTYVPQPTTIEVYSTRNNGIDSDSPITTARATAIILPWQKPDPVGPNGNPL